MHESAGPQPAPYRVAVIGDLRLDVRTAVPASLAEVREDVYALSPVRMVLAGTAVSMARAATRHFEAVHALVKTGDDPSTDHILRTLENEPGVTWCIRQQRGLPNGYVVVLRDGTDSPGAGRRTLVASSPAPVEELSAADVEAFRGAIEAADVLFVDGYPLLFPRSRHAVFHALATAARAGTPVCFDVVPHDIEARLPSDLLNRVMARCQVVMSSARTVARLRGLPAPTPYELPHTRELAAHLAGFGTGEPAVWILRFGDGDMEEAALCQAGEVRCVYRTGYSQCAERTGFGDKVAAAELAALLENGRTRSRRPAA
ncbi:carbohydrate kinase family protein [Streptomyces ferrugineus]|uniref:Carbohydrate kinase family protein n=1 Tax=Streptomyces ferrugineus TaxID=1413221 RepID=A0A7M2SYB3_9ACTN|nr:PfkB family carbohydrate kinase [Streptomyces ferrugineus]QOV40261.1 carbohydrate kinase family protein [Streptomyces ferrugineus]